MASATKPKAASDSAEKPKLPQLGALEEDDEFEEFPVADWDDSETSLAHLTKNSASSDPSKPVTTDQLWEDNWDDDDIEDDFSKQLREELTKMSTTASNPPNDTVMAS